MNIDPDAGTADGVPAEYTADTIKWQKTYGGTVSSFTLNRTTGELSVGRNVRDYSYYSNSWVNDYRTSISECEKGARQF